MRSWHLLLALLIVSAACAPSRRGGSGSTPNEVCGDGIDNDEDGTADEDFPDGCGDDDDAVTDDDDAGESVNITSVHPAPDQDDFFYADDLWVRFDQDPDSVTLSVAGVAGATEVDGRVATFAPSAPLAPNTSYVWTLEWAPSDSSPQQIEFETGPHTDPVGNPSAIIGRTYFIDLGSADFVEPPGIGAILASQLGDFALLMAATAESDLPTMHVLTAVGEFDGPDIVQEFCGTTAYATAGADQIIGTGDDAPGAFDNPQISVGPTEIFLPASFVGIPLTTPLTDVQMTSTFHPDLDDLRGGTVQGQVDTRPLAPELDPDGGEDAVCNLIQETIGVECVECGGDDPGVFCLNLRAVDVRSEHLPSLTLEAQDCADIIAIYETTGECDDEARDWDANEDGEYEGCPAWSEERR